MKWLVMSTLISAVVLSNVWLYVQVFPWLGCH